MKRFNKNLVLAAIATALVACGATGGSTKAKRSESDEAVEVRAQQRWDYLTSGKFAEAWEYLTPGVKSTKPREQYIQQKSMQPVKWISAKYVKKECEKDACTVTMEVNSQIRMQTVGVVDVPSVIEEKWIRLDNSWVHMPKEYVTQGLQ